VSSGGGSRGGNSQSGSDRRKLKLKKVSVKERAGPAEGVVAEEEDERAEEDVVMMYVGKDGLDLSASDVQSDLQDLTFSLPPIFCSSHHQISSSRRNL